MKRRILEEDIKEEINHGIRVSNLAYYVAHRLGLDEEECQKLALIGLLHDIGKLKIAAFLYGRHEDTLTIEETRYVRMHPRLGYDILNKEGYCQEMAQCILYHHENYDGSGYPENLRGERIPLGARILRVCDVYAALTSDRPYRKAFDADTAVALMIDEVKNFDMRVFLTFQQVIHEEDLEEKWAIPHIEVKIQEEQL